VRPRVGKCPVCGKRVHIFSSRWVRRFPNAESVYHAEPRTVIASHPPAGASDATLGCVGHGMEPVADAKLDRERHRRELRRQVKLRELLAAFRGRAAVVYDVLLEGKSGWPLDEVRILARVTVYYYRLFFPAQPLWSVLRYVPRENKRRERSGLGDAYCGFCGVLLHRAIRGGRRSMVGWITDATYLESIALQGDMHAVVCALQHFVFELVPADPSVRRLPPEYVQDEEEPAA
jgi:hypothetical protein